MYALKISYDDPVKWAIMPTISPIKAINTITSVLSSDSISPPYNN